MPQLQLFQPVERFLGHLAVLAGDVCLHAKEEDEQPHQQQAGTNGHRLDELVGVVDEVGVKKAAPQPQSSQNEGQGDVGEGAQRFVKGVEAHNGAGLGFDEVTHAAL